MHACMSCRKTTYGFTRPPRENSRSLPGLPAAAPRMPGKCVRPGAATQPGRRGVRSQGGTAAVWAPSLLARLEKLIIEFLSLPSPPCSSAEKHPGSQPCPFTVTLPANSAQEFLQALCTWKKGWGGGVSRELGRGHAGPFGLKPKSHQLHLLNPHHHH